MEDQLIAKLTQTLREQISEISISLVKSNLGENFWSFEIRDYVARGSGASFDAIEAFQKTVSEFVERLAVKHYAKILDISSSSGFAAHLSLEQAHQASRSELIERDVMLVCWYADIRPCWVSTKQCNFSQEVQQIIHLLEALGISIKVGLLARSADDFVAVGMLDFSRYSDGSASWAFATESDISVERALNKTALSLFRIANLIITRKNKNDALFLKINVNKIFQPEHHLEYYLDPINQHKLIGWWESENQNLLEIPGVAISSSPLELSIAKVLNRFISFSKSTQLIHYFAGIPGDTAAIMNRLDFLGLSLQRDFGDVHPLS